MRETTFARSPAWNASVDHVGSSAMETKYTTIIESGRIVTGVEVSRDRHLGARLGTLLLTAGLGSAYETPDIVVVRTPDGQLHKGPEQRRTAKRSSP
jgi:hypothetical protein